MPAHLTANTKKAKTTAAAAAKSAIKLIPRQAEVLAFIKSYLDETGYPPTLADIARQLGFKSANAS